VEIHKEEKIFVPELIFGHLLTGSNYNDDEKKVVGGRNGYGAKLANIFSNRFVVECGDGKTRKKFRMVWQKNMTMHGEAEIQNYSGKDYTMITFFPDLSRFGMEVLDDDIVSLMNKRVYDMAGLLPSIKVFLNEKEIPINSFMKYVDMYFPNSEESIPKIRDDNVDTDRWQVIVSVSDGEFKQVSFVNSICTTKGGTHVNYITDQIVERIQEKLAKKDKNLNVKPFQIKGHLWIFVNALVENPAFDSQTKETLTLKQSLFGSKCVLSEKLIKDVLKTGIIDDIYNEAKNKELSKLAKMTGGGKKAKLTGIPKLEDANEAGTRNSEKCTLILT
jgi:DNA topoisomerase II